MTALGVWIGLLMLHVCVGVSDVKSARKVLCYHSRCGNNTIYDYAIRDAMSSNNIDWNEYRGNAVLVVNVASFWGSTDQYPRLNALQSTFKDFRVLGVPCNQFGLQEPGDNGTEIWNCLKYVRPGGGFEPNFQLTEKIDVNGMNEHPLFTFLKDNCPPAVRSFAPKDRVHYSELKANDIRWNFEKFLIDRRGVPVMHYSEKYDPSDIEADIRDLLMATSN